MGPLKKSLRTLKNDKPGTYDRRDNNPTSDKCMH